MKELRKTHKERNFFFFFLSWTNSLFVSPLNEFAGQVTHQYTRVDASVMSAAYKPIMLDTPFHLSS